MNCVCEVRYGPMHLRYIFFLSKIENRKQQQALWKLRPLYLIIKEAISITFTVETILFMSLVWCVKIIYEFLFIVSKNKICILEKIEKQNFIITIIMNGNAIRTAHVYRSASVRRFN